MSFNRAYQPLTLDVGNIALGCTSAKVDGSSIGIFNNAEFTLESRVTEIKAGYPSTPRALAVTGITAQASLGFQELSTGFKAILAGLVTSLTTGIVPTHDLVLEIFRPRSENITINMGGAALLQEFDLNFSNDFNSAGFNFEQLVPAGGSILSNITFSTLGEVTYGVPTPMLSQGNVSIGLPKIEVGGITVGPIQSASLKLATVYKRVEVGSPRTLYSLIPLEHSLILDFEAEEITAAVLAANFSLGGLAVVKFYATLFDGSTLTITIPEAKFVPAKGPDIAANDWSSLSKRFIATGSTLLTVA